MSLLDERSARRQARGGHVRSALHTLSSVLIVSGVLLLVDAGLTVLWQEPLSALYAKLKQDQLSGQLEDLAKEDAPSPVELRALASLPDARARLAFAARRLKRKARKGQPIARVRMKRIGVSVVVVEGTDGASLRSGPGHYPHTPLPGAPGTVAIAGHRTTYGAPFRKIDKLRKGDRIEVEMPYGKFSYAVERTQIVPPTRTSVTRRVSFDRLVLTACHPLYSAAQRIVVFARLQTREPSGTLI